MNRGPAAKGAHREMADCWFSSGQFSPLDRLGRQGVVEAGDTWDDGRDPLPVLSAGGHRELFWDGHGYFLYGPLLHPPSKVL